MKTKAVSEKQIVSSHKILELRTQVVGKLSFSTTEFYSEHFRHRRPQNCRKRNQLMSKQNTIKFLQRKKQFRYDQNHEM